MLGGAVYTKQAPTFYTNPPNAIVKNKYYFLEGKST